MITGFVCQKVGVKEPTVGKDVPIDAWISAGMMRLRQDINPGAASVSCDGSLEEEGDP